MPRLRRYPGHRFVGVRRTMTVFDCDDDQQFAALETALGGEVASTFGPDTLAEARNRGFRAPRQVEISLPPK